MNEPALGLEDVVIASSSICFIDGEKGILRYRGYDVQELAEKSSYEEVAYLLINGQLPAPGAFQAFQTELRRNRPVPPEFIVPGRALWNWGLPLNYSQVTRSTRIDIRAADVP